MFLDTFGVWEQDNFLFFPVIGVPKNIFFGNEHGVNIIKSTYCLESSSKEFGDIL